MIEDETENGGLFGIEQLMWWWWPRMLDAHLLCSEGQCVWKKKCFGRETCDCSMALCRRVIATDSRPSLPLIFLCCLLCSI